MQVRWSASALILLAGCASQPRPAPPKFAPARFSQLSLDSPIETICATPAGKAVLDRDLPGLTTRPEYPMFKAMTLKQIQPMSQGKITGASLTKIQTDLAAVKAGDNK